MLSGQLAGVLQPFETDRVLSRQRLYSALSRMYSYRTQLMAGRLRSFRRGMDASNDLLYKKSLEEGINIAELVVIHQ